MQPPRELNGMDLANRVTPFGDLLLHMIPDLSAKTARLLAALKERVPTVVIYEGTRMRQPLQIEGDDLKPDSGAA
jgi:hypothetical protein